MGSSRDDLYERHLLPRVIDLACGVKPVSRKRQNLIPRAAGRVLEIGIGTGLNLPFYRSERVTELIALDPAQQMHGRARKRADAAGLKVRLLGLSAERIPLDDGEIDTVVTTFTLCSIPDPAPAVAEMRRVLKPGGELIFCEHRLAPTDGVQRWQRRLNPVWGKIGGGCQLDRDIPALLGAQFDLTQMVTGYIPGPKFANYHYDGIAT